MQKFDYTQKLLTVKKANENDSIRFPHNGKQVPNTEFIVANDYYWRSKIEAGILIIVPDEKKTDAVVTPAEQPEEVAPVNAAKKKKN